MSRQLRNLAWYEQEEEPKRTEAQIEAEMSMRDLVASPAFDVLKQIAESMIADHQAPIPSKVEHVIHFMSAGIVRQTLTEFLRRIEVEAVGGQIDGR